MPAFFSEEIIQIRDSGFINSRKALKLLNFHTHHRHTEQLSVKSFQAGESPDSGYYSIGVHPWQSEDQEPELKEKLTEVEKWLPSAVALGEVGLDLLRGGVISLQEELLEQQIQLAAHYNKGLIIHCVRSFDRLLHLRKRNPEGTWVVHGFNKNVELARQLRGANIQISFGTALLRSENLQQLCRQLSLEDFFLETDNERPERLPEIYRLASRLHQVEIEQMNLFLCGNFQKRFHVSIR